MRNAQGRRPTRLDVDPGERQRPGATRDSPGEVAAPVQSERVDCFNEYLANRKGLL